MESNKYLKMRPVSETYKYDESAGDVRCFQEWDLYIPREIGQLLIFNGKFNGEWSRILTKDNNHLKIKTVGRAKLMDGDVFDKKIGEHISATKASIKAYKKYNSAAKKIFYAIKPIYDTVRSTYLKTSEFWVAADDHLDEIISDLD